MEWFDSFAAREHELVTACADVEAKRLGITLEEMFAYYEKIKWILGPDEIEGQRLFLQQLAKYQRNPLFYSQGREDCYA